MENGIAEKSLKFAIRVVKLYQYLSEQKREFVLSKQFLRSGTAIGALVREAEHAQSKSDFLNKMNISLKEANETEYWIELLYQAHYLNLQQYNSIRPKIGDLNRLLITIIRTSKERGGK